MKFALEVEQRNRGGVEVAKKGARSSQKWQFKCRFPTAIGVVDCTHAGIEKSRLHGDSYVNCNGNSTLNITATCDRRRMSTSIDLGFPGSLYKSRIMKNATVREAVFRARNTVITADDGCRIEPLLMKPCTSPTGAEHTKFDIQPKEKRAIIEGCFW
ncbi:hypothetical protein J437_LFUL002700 [Ladona fulva]|uniref:DDE Tnp4 domain-containing protein n=1 Tax=Ladona fulva TaxID=123851 RepID=A0A8K0JUL7_LADFU|nr:hypothetical protein J437_LFUL002700 [Ladona fulva]